MGTGTEKFSKNPKKPRHPDSPQTIKGDLHSTPFALRRKVAVISRRRRLSLKHGIIAAALTAILGSMQYQQQQHASLPEQTRLLDVLILISLVACGFVLLRILRSLLRARLEASSHSESEQDDGEDDDVPPISRANSS